jgi:hypothetical protein
MSNICQQCGKVIARGGYPIGGGRTACRFCAVRATGLTTTALRAAHGARIAGENYRKVIKRLRDKIAKYEESGALTEAKPRESIESENYIRAIKRLEEKVKELEQAETLTEIKLRKRIEFLEDEIVSMLDSPEIYDREMQKHGNK